MSQGGDPPSAVLLFELAALRMLGHQPALDHCAECGESPAAGARIAFGLLHGGTLCSRCRAGKRPVVLLSQDAWHVLRRASREPADGVTAPLPREGYGEARAVMNQYLSHLVGHPLKMHEML